MMVIGENQDGKQDTPTPSFPQQTVVAGNSRRGGKPITTTIKKKVAIGIQHIMLFILVGHLFLFLF